MADIEMASIYAKALALSGTPDQRTARARKAANARWAKRAVQADPADLVAALRTAIAGHPGCQLWDQRLAALAEWLEQGGG